jgi:aconitate decarboxylase
MATRSVATWAVALQYQHLPREVVSAAVRSFYNWAGCAIGGSNHEATQIAQDSLAPFIGPGTSSVIGHQSRVRVDAQHAALFNGIASHVHDFDDTHLKTVIHPSGPVCSALLAYADWKRPVSGTDFIVALVAGIEVECKVGLAVWPNHYDVGW